MNAGLHGLLATPLFWMTATFLVFEAMDRLAVESEGRIAGFGLCRPLICEPRLAQRWRVDPQAKPRCVSCDKCSTMPGHRCILP